MTLSSPRMAGDDLVAVLRDLGWIKGKI